MELSTLGLHLQSVQPFQRFGGHNAPRERSIVVEPDSEALIRIGKEQRAYKIWATRSRVHHNADFRFNSQALAVAFTERPTLGGASWPNIVLKQQEREPLHALWANSTLGGLLYWWHSSKQQSGRGRMPRLQAIRMPVLDVGATSEAQLNQANHIFEEIKTRQLLPLNEAFRDEVRKELDYRLLVDVLGIPDSIIPSLDLLREKLCAEPSIHGGKQTKADATSPQSRMRFHVC